VSFRVATVDELQDIAYRDETHMRPVRHHLGITAFGTNAWTAARPMPSSLRRPIRELAVRVWFEESSGIRHIWGR